MDGQGSDFPEDSNLAVSAADTPGTDQPPAARLDRFGHDAGHPGRSDERIASLRALVGRLAPGAVGAGSRIPLGLEALDRALGGGLPRAALHVEAAGDGSAAATGFATFLLARLQRGSDGPAFWLPARADLYGPGLARLGLDTGRLILVEAARPADRLWAFEEALRTSGLAGAVVELDRIDPKSARRLQLAAEAGGTTGIVLQTGNRSAIPGAMTGWSVAALPGARDRNGFPDGFATPRWRLALQRSRIGQNGQWEVEARHDAATDRIALAAAFRDRAPAPVMVG
ncbi:MAG: hypothetical protein WEC00_04150 [Dongiaceae bacterium]